MAADNPNSAEWNNAIARLFENLHSPDFPALMMATIRSQVDFDQGTCIYANDLVPVLLVDYGISPEQKEVQIDSYLSGAYLLDPVADALRGDIASGFYTQKELAPDDFYQSEYFRTYYQRLGLIDDVYFLVILPNGKLISFALGRYQGRPEYSDAELQRFKMFEPIVQQATLQYLRAFDEQTASQAIISPDMNRQLETAFNCFGASVLTERESELVRLLLRGHSNQSAADKMGISIDTVKMHRKNINGKLDITSQAELFSLFISSLACVQQGSAQDPLATYLSVPQRPEDG